MKTILNVAILYGGESSEHEISQISALSVYKHINTDLFHPILIGITQSGCWYQQSDFFQSELSALTKLPIEESPTKIVFVSPGRGLFVNGKKLAIDFVFPVLHGTNGEDGTVQGLLELLHLPYAGSNVIGSSVGMDKTLAKRIWEQVGISVVPFAEMSYTQYHETSQAKLVLQSILNKLSFPLFVKPVNAGSSVGCHKAHTVDELNSALKDAFKYDTRVLIENYVNPREVECAVLGNDNPMAFPPGEIKANTEFYDYDSKYNDPNAATLDVEADLPKETIVKITETAKKAYSAINASGFARVDFFIDKDNGKIYLNEINTLPGFTQISMFPKMCEHAGIPYTDLITKIIELGIERNEIQKTRTGILS